VVTEQVCVLVIDELSDNVELGVVGIKSSHQLLVGTLVAENPTILNDIDDFVVARPSVGLPLKVAECEIRELFEKFSGSL